MDKFYSISIADTVFKVRPARAVYPANGTLAVVLLDEDDDEFCVLTVNLKESVLLKDKVRAFVDTNNCPWAEEFLKENDLAVSDGRYASSGFCTYPLYIFDIEKIPEM